MVSWSIWQARYYMRNWRVVIAIIMPTMLACVQVNVRLFIYCMLQVIKMTHISGKIYRAQWIMSLS